MKRHSCRSGFTLTEVMLSVALLAGLCVLASKGIQIFNDVKGQDSQVQAQQEAEIVLYSVIKDVRNARRIVNVAPDSLTLELYNVDKGYDTADTALFDDANVSTVTYSFVENQGNTYLRRVKAFGAQTAERKSLTNLLRVPTADEYLFRTAGNSAAVPIRGINVALRLRERYGRNIRVYQATAMRRASEG